MNIFSNLVLFTLLFGAVTGATPVNAGTQYVSDGNTNMFNVEDTNTDERVTRIDNEITNMLSGKVSPGEVEDDVFDEKFFAKERCKSMTGEELEENEMFIEYLKSCNKVIKAYQIEDPDLKSRIDEMNEIKNSF